MFVLCIFTRSPLSRSFHFQKSHLLFFQSRKSPRSKREILNFFSISYGQSLRVVGRGTGGFFFLQRNFWNESSEDIVEVVIDM